MNSRSAARPMLPSSQTATNNCSDVRSMRRAKLRSDEDMRGSDISYGDGGPYCPSVFILKSSRNAMTWLPVGDGRAGAYWRFLEESSIFSPAFCTSWPAPLQVLQPCRGTARVNATAINAASLFITYSFV